MSSRTTASTAISPPHLLGLVVGALCIAFAPIFAVQAVRFGGVGMWDSAFWRVFLGALALALLLMFQGESLLGPRGVSSDSDRLRGWIWIPGIIFAGDFWAWHWSFEHTSVANSTLLANVAILIVTLFAWLVWKERLSRKFVGGSVLAFAGVTLLMLSSAKRQSPTGGDPVFGDLLALLTACFYAAYQLTMKRYRRLRSAPVLMFWASLVAAVCLFPLAWYHADPFWPENGWRGWWPLIGLGVLSHACGQGLISYGLGGVPASLASVVLLVQPVATALLGLVLLGQPLVLWQTVGGIAVVAGLFLAIRGQVALARQAPAAPATDR